METLRRQSTSVEQLATEEIWLQENVAVTRARVSLQWSEPTELFTVLQTEAQDLCLPARLHKKGLGMLNPPLDVPVGPKGTTPRVSPSVATSHSGMSLDVQQDQSCVTTETLGGQTEWSHDVETFYRWRACLDTHRWKELNSMWMSLPPTVPYVWQSIQSWSVSFTLPTGLIPPLSDGAVLQQDGLELGGLCQGAHETVRLTEPLGEAFCHVCPAMCSPSSPWGVSPDAPRKRKLQDGDLGIPAQKRQKMTDRKRVMGMEQSHTEFEHTLSSLWMAAEEHEGLQVIEDGDLLTNEDGTPGYVLISNAATHSPLIWMQYPAVNTSLSVAKRKRKRKREVSAQLDSLTSKCNIEPPNDPFGPVYSLDPLGHVATGDHLVPFGSCHYSPDAFGGEFFPPPGDFTGFQWVCSGDSGEQNLCQSNFEAAELCVSGSPLSCLAHPELFLKDEDVFDTESKFSEEIELCQSAASCSELHHNSEWFCGPPVPQESLPEPVSHSLKEFSSPDFIYACFQQAELVGNTESTPLEGAHEHVQLEPIQHQHDAVQHDAVQHEAVQYEAVQHEAVQHDAVQHEFVQREAVRHDAVQHEAVQHEAVQHEAVQHDAVQHDAVQHDAVQHEAVQHNAVQHEAVQHEVVQREAVQHEAVQHDAVQHEAVQHEAVQREAVQHEAVQHDAVQHEVVQHDAVQHEAVQHEAVQHEAVQHEAVQHEAISQGVTAQQLHSDIIMHVEEDGRLHSKTPVATIENCSMPQKLKKSVLYDLFQPQGEVQSCPQSQEVQHRIHRSVTIKDCSVPLCRLKLGKSVLQRTFVMSHPQAQSEANFHTQPLESQVTNPYFFKSMHNKLLPSQCPNMMAVGEKETLPSKTSLITKNCSIPLFRPMEIKTDPPQFQNKAHSHAQSIVSKTTHPYCLRSIT